MRGRAISALFAAALSVAPAPAGAQGQPFDSISSIVGWFDRLNRSWDRIVTEQERQQLLRALDGLRRQLFVIQGDSQLLLDSVPDAPPDAVERGQLTAQVDTLQKSVEGLRQTTATLSAELQDGEAAERVTRAGATRGAALRFAESNLRRSVTDPKAWQPGEVRSRLRDGLAALKAAQAAVTKFRGRLAAQR